MPRTLIDEGDAARAVPLPPRPGPARERRPRAAREPLAAPAPATTCAAAARWWSTWSRRSADLPRGVRRGLLPRTAAWAWSTGSTRSSPRRSRRPPRTPAGDRCTSWAGAWAVSSPCSPRPTARDLPIASLTVLGSPGRRGAGARWSRRCGRCCNLADGPRPVTRAYRVVGGAPKPLVGGPSSSRRCRSSSPSRWRWPPISTTPSSWPRSRPSTGSPDRMIAYPGRTFGQLYHRFVKGNALVAGPIELGERTIDVADVAAPCWSSPAPPTDRPGPGGQGRGAAADRARRRSSFEIVPGGHLGMLTGRRRARPRPGRSLDEWVRALVAGSRLARRSPGPGQEGHRGSRAAAKKAPAKKTATTRVATRKKATETAAPGATANPAALLGRA